MAKKHSTLVNELLFWLDTVDDVLSVFIASKHQWKKRMLGGRWKNYRSYRSTVYGLRKRGVLEIVSKNGQRFLKLTRKGELEALLAKARVPVWQRWDGKWRVVIFDIPEATSEQRAKFRRLLKANGFKKLQGSVYISPYPLSRDAVKYLKKTHLDEFIRILKVEEIDDDKDLRKKFRI